MIRGLYGGRHLGRSANAVTPVPFLEGLLWLPEFDVDRRVIFLVDTGADLTVLHPRDSDEMLLPEHWAAIRTKPPRRIAGAGQMMNYYPTDAILHLISDDDTLDRVAFTIFVGEPHPRTADVESLLGRDVLGEFTAIFDHNMTLTLER